MRPSRKKIPAIQKFLQSPIAIFVVASFILVISLFYLGYTEKNRSYELTTTVDPVRGVIMEKEERDTLLSAVAGAAVALYDAAEINIGAIKSFFSPSLVSVYINAGLRKEEVAKIFAKKLNWDEKEQEAFMQEKTAYEDVEGYFYPGEYLVSNYYRGSDVSSLMTERFKEEVEGKYASSTAEIVSMETAINIASIIQREAAGKRDMKLISGIIWNRVFKGMNLQMDATLQYAKGNEEIGWWPPVRPEDKYIESPYNTYMNNGLPPTAIASPSLAAIEAALNPKKTDCLFYVHDRLGRIYCSKTYEQHKANVRKAYGAYRG